MAKATGLPKGITPEMIEAFMAKQAQEAAEAAAKEAAKAAKATGLMTTAEVREKYPVMNMECVVKEGSRKITAGLKVECHYVGFRRWGNSGNANARITLIGGDKIMIDGNDAGWINPKFLKAVKPLSDARIAAVAAERAATSIDPEETLAVPCRVVDESREKSILLHYKGAFSPRFFAKEHVVRLGHNDDDLGVFELPSWKVAKDWGQSVYRELKANQDTIKAGVIEE